MTDAMRGDTTLAGAGASTGRTQELTWADFAGAAVRRPRILFGTPVAVFALVVTWAFVSPRTYTSVAIFFPAQAPALSGGLAGFASQLGVRVPGQDPTQSPDFYAQLIASATVLSPVAKQRFAVPDDARCPCTLAGYWKYDDHPPEVATELAIRKLRSSTRTIPGVQTGSVELQVATGSAALSSQLAQAIIAQLNHVNQTVRAGQASAERRFVQGRLAAAESTLASAEAAMRRFLELNRQYKDSPALSFEWQRLSREVSLRETLYASLAQQNELAGIQEVRNTPVIEVAQAPTVPPLPDGRWLAVKGFAAIAVGVLLAVFYTSARLALFEASDIPRVSAEDVARTVASRLRSFGRRVQTGGGQP